MHKWVVVGGLLAALGACSSSTIGNDAGPDATTDAVADVASPADAATDADGAVAETGTDAPVADASGCLHASDAGPTQCNTLPTPSKIAIGCVSNPPAPSGGTLVDGLYVLTQVDWDATYFDGGCPANQTHGGTIEICANVLEWFDLDTVSSTYVGSLVFTPNGAQLQLTQFCPGPSAPYSVGYTANSTDLVLWLTYPNGPTLMMHFTRQ